MSQRDIINYLIKYPETWISRDEIIRVIGVSKYSANISIRNLVQAGEIERRYERVDNPNIPNQKRVLTWIKLTESYKKSLRNEGLL